MSERNDALREAKQLALAEAARADIRAKQADTYTERTKWTGIRVSAARVANNIGQLIKEPK